MFPIYLRKSDLKNINWIEQIKEYLVIQENGNPLLVSSICKHNQVRLPKLKEGETCIKCPAHGWVLNIQKSEYENPIGIKQLSSKYTLKVHSDLIEINESNKVQKNFEWIKRPKEILSLNEFSISFINHACMLFETPKLRLISDPWIIGSAFCTGWFLIYKTKKKFIEKILSTDYVYLSHSHPDHLNPISLLWLKAKGWDPIFIVPNFNRKDIIKPALSALGFNKVIELDNKQIFRFKDDPNVALQMVMDLTERNDSGIIFNYKGHQVLNLVDCPSPDIEGLENLDISLIPFANGASGYPVCWEDQYSEKEIFNKKKISNIKAKERFYSTSKILKTKVSIPFAGYFEESLTEDRKIQKRNSKNTSIKIIKDRPISLETDVINPLKEYKKQILEKGITLNFEQQIIERVEENDKWRIKFRNNIKERYSNFTKKELIDFLSIQNYSDNLSVNFYCCNIDFSKTFWQLTWHFNSESGENSEFKNIENNRVLNIKVRNYALGYTIRNSLPWEEFSIGFQARFSRSPDTYNFKFWDYFQNEYCINSPLYGDLLNLWDNSPEFRLLFEST